jgi:S-adenosyl methyltransferase
MSSGHSRSSFRRAGSEPPNIDATVAHVARVYNYWLGGKDNFAADREAGDEAIRAYPDLVSSARANRAFLTRTVRYLAEKAGIRQFLDIGMGIPTTEDNTHEVAQSVAPECRVVYVDNDPMVLAHARALLRSSPQGVTECLDADVRDPEEILREASWLLDFTEPVAVMLVAVLHLVSDGDDPYGIVSQLMAAVPPGSSLTISHVPNDMHAAAMKAMRARLNRLLTQRSTYRSREQVTRFFDGLELVPPGVVPIQQWNPGTEEEAGAAAAMWGGVALKP